MKMIVSCYSIWLGRWLIINLLNSQGSFARGMCGVCQVNMEFPTNVPKWHVHKTFVEFPGHFLVIFLV
jgi:hypothetical protein